MTIDMNEPLWQAVNRANWDERVAIHLGAESYDLSDLRAGHGRLHPIEEAEIGPVDGLRILHLQCHFGRDTLTLAQRGAEVVGLDFSEPAILAARQLADELGLGDRARFVEAGVYEAPDEIGEAAAFDGVFVTWGAIGWLPDLAGWARVVAHFLKPGGWLYLAEGHPAAQIFEAGGAEAGDRPDWFVPYFHREPLVLESTSDYADPTAVLDNTQTYQWQHTLADILGALRAAGLSIDMFHEHDSVPWQMFPCLRRDAEGMYRWQDRPWLPLAFSLRAIR